MKIMGRDGIEQDGIGRNRKRRPSVDTGACEESGQLLWPRPADGSRLDVGIDPTSAAFCAVNLSELRSQRLFSISGLSVSIALRQALRVFI